ncbi:MAG: dihydrofolate reductase family protein [Flavisolibacter sp.]|nr:dihydrofolate reductase family protein [Flavisolibacter sp.]
MRKLVAAINMSLDGFCDHTAGIPDEEIHLHYADLLNSADIILYGRITYQLMEYWKTVVENPTGNKAMDEFAVTFDKIPKLVFSHTLKKIEWETAKLAKRGLEEEVVELKQSRNGGSKDILVGSPGLILSLMKLNLIDELQLCVHPVVVGSGLPLFKDMNNRVQFNLLKTKTFNCGAIILYYEPGKK